MNTYILLLMNDNVSVCEYNGSAFEYLKYKGEDTWEFHEGDFWGWFQKKVEYDNEEIRFIVMTDKDAFVVPDGFVLGDFKELEKDPLFIEQLKKLYIANTTLLTFPHSEYIQTLQVRYELAPKPLQQKVIKANSLQEHYIKQTVEYENAKK